MASLPPNLRFVPSLLLLLAQALQTTATGLIGHGTNMYQPVCAFACRAAIASYPLTCSTLSDEVAHGGHGGGHGAGPTVITTAECRAGNEQFLETLGWCLFQRCEEEDGIKGWMLEKYWMESASGDPKVGPIWGYKSTVDNVLEMGLPNGFWEAAEEGDHSGGHMEAELDVPRLEKAVLVNANDYLTEKGTLSAFEKGETLHSRYGIIALLAGIILPILLSLPRHLSFLSGPLSKISTSLIYPHTISHHHITPLPYSLGNPPTLGQSILILVFVLINFILSATGYPLYQPNTWFGTSRLELLAYLSNRTGVLSFANIPLMILYSSRNNPLIAITSWSHNTFLLLHRWIARICTVQAIVHSLIYLVVYVENKGHAAEVKLPYWYWGIIGTVVASLMLVVSTLWFRKKAYEVFLLLHIALGILFLVGCWYHIEYRYKKKWGYEIWLYISFAVWAAERLSRVFRIVFLSGGLKTAKLTKLGDGENIVLKVEIEGVKWGAALGKHAYLYFPTVGWKVWENHPFSVAADGVVMRVEGKGGVEVTTVPAVNPTEEHTRHMKSTSSSTDEISSVDLEKSATVTAIPQTPKLDNGAQRVNKTNPGLTFYIRPASGLTSKLARLSKPSLNLRILLEGPYTSPSSSQITTASDRLIVIAGGIGVTGVIPYLYSNHKNTKLYWSCREPALVQEVSDNWLHGQCEREIRVGSGRRFDLGSLVREEAIVLGKGTLGVVVCGPGSMCDKVRATIVRVGREMGNTVKMELEVEAFTW